MRVLSIFLCLLILSGCSKEKIQIPEYLVGIWASKNAVIKNENLSEGLAVYLFPNGEGAYVVGPPPIGFILNAEYHHDKNTIVYEIIEHGKVLGKREIIYNPATKTINADGIPLTRYANKITNEKYLE